LPEVEFPVSSAPVESKWTRLGRVIKHEAEHYWKGLKLLYANTRVSRELLTRLADGYPLTRRERRQLTRTTADLVRLVPFVMMVLIPFAELALPLLVKLNMLPSTFDEKERKEAMRKAKLKMKIEVAQFLQETTSLLTTQLMQKRMTRLGDAALPKKVTPEDFNQFIHKVKTGLPVENAEILKYSKFFEDDLTLEHLNRQQLVAMCKLLDVSAWFPTAGLRRAIEHRINQIIKDDRAIMSEGIDTMTYPELQDACRARGINPERGETQLKRKLNEWLELSLKEDVPVSLLVLSRAFSATMSINKDSIKTTLSHLPDVAVEDAKSHVEDVSASEVEEKLTLLEEEAKRIQQEREEELEKARQLAAIEEEKQRLKDKEKRDKEEKEAERKQKELAEKKEQKEAAEEEKEEEVAVSEEEAGSCVAVAKPDADLNKLVEELAEIKDEFEEDHEEINDQIEELRKEVSEEEEEDGDGDGSHEKAPAPSTTTTTAAPSSPLFSSAELEAFKALFDQLDADHDGSIDFGELNAALSRLGLNAEPSTALDMMKNVDKDQDGTIEFDEFLDIVFNLKRQTTHFFKYYIKRKDILHDARAVEKLNARLTALLSEIESEVAEVAGGEVLKKAAPRKKEEVVVADTNVSSSPAATPTASTPAASSAANASSASSSSSSSSSSSA